MNVTQLSLIGFMTSMAFTMFIVAGSDQEGVIYEEGISKWNLIPFAYVIDLANWSSMDCQEKHDELNKGISMKTIMVMKEQFELSELNPISFTLENCLESKN